MHVGKAKSGNPECAQGSLGQRVQQKPLCTAKLSGDLDCFSSVALDWPKNACISLGIALGRRIGSWTLGILSSIA